MPIHRERYPKDWNAIAHSVKSAADWKCQHCGKVCLRPGEKPKTTKRSEWTHMVLTVHHADFTPENNNQENLIPLCAPCHLALHARTKRSNTSPGQLSLWWQFSHRYSFGTSARPLGDGTISKKFEKQAQVQNSDLSSRRSQSPFWHGQKALLH